MKLLSVLFWGLVFITDLQRFLARYPLLSVDFSTSNYREEMMTGMDVAVRFRSAQRLVAHRAQAAGNADSDDRRTRLSGTAWRAAITP